ncbi:MAG: hypothetical protein ACI4K9_04640 [Candidatus Fimenecus sp.]
MTPFFKNGLVGLLGYLAAEAVMMVGSFFFADGPHSRADCIILGIVYLVSLAAAFLVGQWRGKQFESRLKTVLSVLALPAVFVAYPLLLAVILNTQWVTILLVPTYLPGNFLCMATDCGVNGWNFVLCMIGAPLCILLATAVGTLFSHDTAE